MDKITLIEALKMKRAMEMKLADAINDFEHNTKLVVEGVKISSETVGGAMNPRTVIKVEAVVKL